MNARQRDRKIAELQETLDRFKEYEAAGIDPVTLKNLPRYKHEVETQLVHVAKPTTKVNVGGLMDKWGRK